MLEILIGSIMVQLPSEERKKPNPKHNKDFLNEIIKLFKLLSGNKCALM